MIAMTCNEQGVFWGGKLDWDPVIMCGLVSQVEYHLMVDPKGGNYSYYHFGTISSKSGEMNIIWNACIRSSTYNRTWNKKWSNSKWARCKTKIIVLYSRGWAEKIQTLPWLMDGSSTGGISKSYCIKTRWLP
jgi:hypothetical protein